MSEKVVFFTFVSDTYYVPIGCPKMINSFKRFHPDIDLVIFRQDMVDSVFNQYGVNFFNAKATFAKLLTPYYDLVVNVDADSIFLGRCESILATDYEVGAPTNLNSYENRHIENITDEMYIQGGLIASRNKHFWDIYDETNRDAYKYLCAENDILSLIWYNDPEVKKMKRKIFDKDKDYYGCKSLGLEGEFYVEDDKIMCRKEQVFIYHHAKGGWAMPKLEFERMGFPDDATRVMKAIAEFGKSVRYTTI